MKKGKNLNVWLAMSMFLLLMVSTATAEIIFVDADANGLNNGSSWTDAYNYLQDALADANSAAKPVEIRVAQGIYKPDQGAGVTTGDRTATFQLKNGVAIKGGYAGFGEPDPNARDMDLYETILSGDLDGNDVDVNDPEDLQDEPSRAENSYHVVTGSGTDETAVLDGFTITAGNANGPIPDRRGGGIYNTSGSPKLTNCIFSENSARSSGGGMWNWGSFTTLTKCRFSRNSAGDGGGIGNPGNATLTNCAFSGNSAYWGGGMYNGHHNNVILTDCTFSGNSAMTGGGMRNMDSSNVILINCVFSGNSADKNGGGMYCEQTSTTHIVNCTFSRNSAQEKGGGLYIALPPVPAGGPSSKMGDGTCTITNCIFWENWPQQIVNLSGFRLAASYNDVQGGWAGEGNIDADPLFVDANNRDYHLKSQAGRWEPSSASWVQDAVTSPCIDAGDPMSPIGYEPFPNGGRINMGAYGGTAEGSKSYFGEPLCKTIVAGDINGDCKVNFVDFRIMAFHWLERTAPRPKSHENYFPVHVGNSWTYVDCNDGSTKTFTIIGTQEINGHTYYKFDDYWGEVREGEEYLFRYEANRVLMWDSWWYNRHGEEVVRYDFTGGDYWDGGIYGICRLKRGDVSCNVPAGEFSDCINFQFLAAECGPDAYKFGEYLAPNVGNVEYVVPGGPCLGSVPGWTKEGEVITFELQSYTIISD